MYVPTKKYNFSSRQNIVTNQAVNNQDHRINWLTFKNIIKWNKATKDFLVLIGMGTPEQGLICKLIAFTVFIIAISNNCSGLLFHFIRRS